MSVVQSLATTMARNWWVVLLRGLVAIFFGVLTWARPGISLAALVLVFGGFALADGVLALWAAVTGRRHHEDWWVLMLEGLTHREVSEVVGITEGNVAVRLSRAKTLLAAALAKQRTPT